MKRIALRLAVALILAACVGFTTSDVPVAPQQPTAGPPPANPAPQQSARARGDFTIHERHLVYVTLPGSLERPIFPNGDGIVVLDADHEYAFVRRIHVWEYAASMSPEDISGVAASPATNMLYLAARGRL